jgi:hypothetical protein
LFFFSLSLFFRLSLEYLIILCNTILCKDKTKNSFINLIFSLFVNRLYDFILDINKKKLNFKLKQQQQPSKQKVIFQREKTHVKLRYIIYIGQFFIINNKK